MILKGALRFARHETRGPRAVLKNPAVTILINPTIHAPPGAPSTLLTLELGERRLPAVCRLRLPPGVPPVREPGVGPGAAVRVPGVIKHRGFFTASRVKST